MKKSIKTALWIGIPVIGIIGAMYGVEYFRKKRFNKSCLENGGKVVEDGRICEK